MAGSCSVDRETGILSDQDGALSKPGGEAWLEDEAGRGWLLSLADEVR